MAHLKFLYVLSMLEFLLTTDITPGSLSSTGPITAL